MAREDCWYFVVERPLWGWGAAGSNPAGETKFVPPHTSIPCRRGHNTAAEFKESDMPTRIFSTRIRIRGVNIRFEAQTLDELMAKLYEAEGRGE